jgi:hypothetical protein
MEPVQNFEDRLSDVRDQSYINGYYMYDGSQPRTWMVPSNFALDPDDPTTLGQPFDRSAANEGYATVISSGAAAGKAMGFNIQINYLACMERAFRERHKTRCRGYAHTIARFGAHGQANGVHYRVFRHAADWLSVR